MVNDWNTKPLGDIAEIFNGNSIAAKEKRDLWEGKAEGIPFIATKDVGFDYTINYANGVRISGAKSDELKIAPAGATFVCAEGGSAGRKIGFNSEQVHFGNKLFAVVPHDDVADKYVFYYCISQIFRDQFNKNLTGLIGGVSIRKFKNIPIPLAPLPEQRRIVMFLDEAFVGLDKAIANTQQNLTNVRALFESHLNKVIEELSTAESSVPLEELCEVDRGITYGVIKLGDHCPAGVPCLRTSNVRWLDIDVTGLKRISPELSNDYSRTVLLGGEVLVNVRGTLGGVAVVPNDMADWNISREVAMVPSDPDKVNSNYLSLVIGSKRSQNWLTGVLKGVAYTGINLGDLRQLNIPLPSKQKQIEIADHLGDLLDLTRQSEKIFGQKLDALAELKQSILHKAFSGELTAHEAAA